MSDTIFTSLEPEKLIKTTKNLLQDIALKKYNKCRKEKQLGIATALYSLSSSHLMLKKILDLPPYINYEMQQKYFQKFGFYLQGFYKEVPKTERKRCTYYELKDATKNVLYILNENIQTNRKKIRELMNKSVESGKNLLAQKIKDKSLREEIIPFFTKRENLNFRNALIIILKNDLNIGGKELIIGDEIL